jgi:hypothetical protein
MTQWRSATSCPPSRAARPYRFANCGQTIYGRYRLWIATGLWEQILGVLAKGRSDGHTEVLL